MSIRGFDPSHLLLGVLAPQQKAGAGRAILHGWQTLPESVRSDIDFAITESDLAHLEMKLLSSQRARLVQLLQHESTCYYFVLMGWNGEAYGSLLLDSATDYRRDGCVFFSADELLRDAGHWNGLCVAAPDVEFKYLIVKKILKGSFPERQRQRLAELVHALPPGAPEATATRLLGDRLGSQFIELIQRGAWAGIEHRLPTLRRQIRWQVLKRDPLNPFRYWVPEIKRRWLRWRYPTGLFIAVLGPDGAGKSTLIDHLERNLAGAFRRTRQFHLRPHLSRAKANSEPVTDPHSQEPRSLVSSMLKLGYYLADYCMGYVWSLRPALVRSTLVLFDRYFQDLPVDPIRYRYGGPSWAVRLLRRFIPQPDLFLVLDVPEEEVRRRKIEVSEAETHRQRQRYLELAMELPSAVVIDGAVPEKDVARQATDVVLDFLHGRYLRRRHIWFGKDHDEGTESLLSALEQAGGTPGPAEATTRGKEGQAGAASARNRDFLAVNLGLGRRAFLPAVPRKVAMSAMSLYNPQSFKARLGKKVLALGIRAGVAQRFLPRVRLQIDGLTEHLKAVLGRNDVHLAVYLGPPGPQRKPVFKLMDGAGELVGYAKAGWDETTLALVQNEVRVLRELAGRSLSFQVPRVLYAGEWNGLYVCVQSGPTGKIRPAPKALTTDHGPATSDYVQVVKDLRAIHYQEVPLVDSDFWKRLRDRTGNVTHSYYRHVLAQGMAVVEKELGSQVLPFHLCHGDLTPWNTLRTKGQLYIFDWEYSEADTPAGWDAVHFLFQTGMLLAKDQPRELVANLEAQESIEDPFPPIGRAPGPAPDARKRAALLYCLGRLVFYAADNSSQFEKLRTYAKLVQLLTLR